MGVLLKLFRWLFSKAATAGLILGLGLAACGLWLFLRDNVDFDEWRHDLLRSINGERAKVQSALGDVHQRMDRLTAEVATEQERIRQTDSVITQLKGLDSTWDKLTGDAQQRANSERREKLEKLRAESAAKVTALQSEFTRTTWERDGLEIALGKLAVQLRTAEAKQSKVMHYLSLAWNYQLGRMKVKWWVIIVLGLYFFGPTAGKLALYHAVAPLIVRGRPVRLVADLAELPRIGISHVSADVTLQPGERLLVKEKFLQASDEGLKRKTRFVLDWHIPFTCLATGLIELVELRNIRTEGAQVCTLSNQADAHSELAIVTLPPESAMVIRPSFLAGVIRGKDQGLLIRRRGELGVGLTLLMLIIGAIVLVGLGLIPWVGPAIVGIAVVLGTGAFTRTIGGRLRRADPAPLI